MARQPVKSGLWRAKSAWSRHPARSELEMRLWTADRMRFNSPQDRQAFVAPFVYMATEIRLMIELHHGQT